MENKQKHLEFIQGTIARMAGNLFFLRGWTISLVAGLLALFAKDASISLIFIVYFLVIIFWILDGYFLSQERLFRALYNHVRKLDEKEIDFSMDTSKYKKDKENGWLCSMFSSTLLVFYLPLAGITFLIAYLIIN
jgi:ABC-type multidrug transport system fused ATPase/permease subunit